MGRQHLCSAIKTLRSDSLTWRNQTTHWLTDWVTAKNMNRKNLKTNNSTSSSIANHGVDLFNSHQTGSVSLEKIHANLYSRWILTEHCNKATSLHDLHWKVNVAHCMYCWFGHKYKIQWTTDEKSARHSKGVVRTAFVFSQAGFPYQYCNYCNIAVLILDSSEKQLTLVGYFIPWNNFFGYETEFHPHCRL